MQTISAANNLLIEADEITWRLVNKSTPDDFPLVEAKADVLSYQPAFAKARKLPENALPLNQIEMVIVGWENGHWHLGLLLNSEIATERGGRWCGIVRWADPTATTETSSARLAGQLLSGALGKPYQFVAAQVAEEDDDEALPLPVAPSAAQVAEDDTTAVHPVTDEDLDRPRLPDVQLLKPPITVGDWALVENRMGYNWEHSKGWRVGTILRAVFFGVLALIFILLSAGGLRSNFAPVQPEWLPVVGAVISILMAVLAIMRLIELARTSSVQFDFRSRMMRVTRKPKGVIKQVPFEKIDFVLVSQLIQRREALKNPPPNAPPTDHVVPEVWLHVQRAKGDFVEIGHVNQSEGRALRRGVDTRLPRRVLHLDEIDTPAHQAARLIAEAMEVPVLLEDRT